MLNRIIKRSTLFIVKLIKKLIIKLVTILEVTKKKDEDLLD